MKCQMQAILRDPGIEEYIKEGSAPPVTKTLLTEADIRSGKQVMQRHGPELS